ncbi:MAG: alpha/beta hydrolase [Actinomycetota bacterium]|nr:alpha/beta hydrolase [Actinomycetota bacterium]
MRLRLRRLLGLGLGGWALWRMFGPDPSPRLTGPQVRPLRVPGRTVFVGDSEFFIREAGPADAAPILLIHGWSFDGEMTYVRVIDPLAATRRVLVPDLRNHGKSDWIRGGYEIADLADEVAGILYAVDTPPVTVMGYSLGGMVAQELARRHPGLVKQLVLAATAARPVPVRRLAARTSFWLGSGLGHISSIETTRITEGLLRRKQGIDPAEARWLDHALRRRDPHLYFQAGSAAWRFDSRGWVGGLRIPTVVVVNTRDWVVPTAAQRELAELTKAAEVIEVDAGHESILTRPDVYVDLLVRLTKPAGARPVDRRSS